MTWYSDKLEDLYGDSYFNHGKDNRLDLSIVNLKTEQDALKLKEGLKSLQGIKSVHVDLNSSKLTVFYNPEEISVISIAYAVNRLGFTHIGKT